MLTPLNRLALSYAPASSRPQFLALFTLDARLAGIVRAAREPLLGQMRLAWWRDRLAEDCSLWPAGEPVLAALQSWRGQHQTLAPLVDGWEALLGDLPLTLDEFCQNANGRGQSFAALAQLSGNQWAAQDASRMGANWGLADLASHVSHPDEKTAILNHIGDQDWTQARLPRALRPLTVLHGLARRDRAGGHHPVLTILAAIRLGLLGR